VSAAAIESEPTASLRDKEPVCLPESSVWTSAFVVESFQATDLPAAGVVGAVWLSMRMSATG
jgi:hypothetical protein